MPNTSYILKPNQKRVLRYASEEYGDIVVDSRLRSAYAIIQDGSRRKLNPQQTTTVIQEVRRRLEKETAGSDQTPDISMPN